MPSVVILLPLSKANFGIGRHLWLKGRYGLYLQTHQVSPVGAGFREALSYFLPFSLRQEVPTQAKPKSCICSASVLHATNVAIFFFCQIAKQN